MEKRSQLRARSRCGWAVCLAGLLWASSLACEMANPPQSATAPDTSDSAPGETATTPKAQEKNPPPSGVWHHFGESQEVAGAAQSQPGSGNNSTKNPGAAKVGSYAKPGKLAAANRMADLERHMWALVNQDRSKPATFAETRGRALPLRWNDRLAAVARSHSRNMLEHRFFSHVDPEGRTFSARITRAGIPWKAAGENIAIYPSIWKAEAGFMNEPRFEHNHRANILNTSYTDVGIGIVEGPDGSLYITQDFIAAPPNRRAVWETP